MSLPKERIPDDKANSSIAEYLVTEFLSFVVTKSPPQEIFVIGKKLSYLLDVNIIHDGSSSGGGREPVK